MLQQAWCGHAHLFGRIARFVGGLPQDGSTAFGRDDRVGAVFEHQGAITDTNCQRASGPAFTNHRADHRNAQFRHFQQIAGDGFGLAAFFRADAGIRAGGVDEGQQRQTEALGQLHDAQGFAVALRAWHAEVALDLGLGIATFLMPDDRDRAAIDATDTADQCRIIGEGAIPGEFLELLTDRVDVVLRVGSLRVTRQLGDLPGRQRLENFLCARLEFGAETGNVLFDVEGRALTGMSQFLDLGIQFGDGLFEIEEVLIHCELGDLPKEREYSQRARWSHRYGGGWRRVVPAAIAACIRSWR
ncbi:MAG: hypothetical protein BWZ07_01633 [Alphaproteobacteria bacterium ADurb.BinA280]|nr:MAG: hypothetical protein BWZ07_01633 [Alphaproteobacteria bacterium ADurb.BinA280]